LQSATSALFNTELSVVSFLIRSTVLDVFISVCVIILVVCHLLWNGIKVPSFIVLLMLWVA
jgi:hypothetical protein